MAAKLRVLVLESERGAADSAIDELTTAGHAVVRCHEPGDPAFPCGALADDPHCPVRDEIVDVALTVRTRPRSQPAPHEDGVSCALERHIPLVVAGATALNPFEKWATEVVDRPGNVVEALERAAVAPLPRHAEKARAALAEVLHVRGLDGSPPDVVVRRGNGRLVVTVLDASDEYEQATKSMMSVRMIGALREFDKDAGGIDVVFE
jgi:hypothetical protein